MRIGSKETTGWKATISVAMSNYIEAGSIIAIATSLSLWQERFGIDDFAVGLLAAISANAFGAAIGAAVGGPLCDRYGRKFIYTYDLLLYMVGVLLAAFAVSYPMLLIAFLITGIAVGAGVPASWTYIAEEAPPAQRAKHVGTAQLAWSMGPVLGFLLAVVLTGPLGLLGSRVIFGHLFVVAFIVWYIRQGLHESTMWKESRVADANRRRGGLRALFTGKANITALLFLFGVYGGWNVVAGQMGIFMPRVYETAGVESATEQNLLQVLLWSCTVLATYFGFMLLADKISRRLLYVVGAALGIFAWVLLVFANATLPILLLFAVSWGISAGIGAQAFYALWTSELFATPYRASAQGVLFFAVRLAIGLLSYFFPTMLATQGVPAVGLVMIGLLAFALIVGAIWAPRTQGRSLQEIERERYGEVVSAELTTPAKTTGATA
ncbi:MFS transporter [Pseudonocardia halophobica]|uniref:MFS transporter n=1 Tax=Pseudonocardia halophobica TaxID=29401 RepID=A0A9W6UEQ1_9PSEU|nr:MFS transporter [Pseudonocardia halophobica]GLL15980.1 MFS transporter [Pseudonocardia halophobica]